MSVTVKLRYRLYRRPSTGVFYCQDNETGRQESLGTRIAAEAQRLLSARNEADAAPAFNRHLARVYWQAGDPAAGTRTWQFVMEEMGKHKDGPTLARWLIAIKDHAFDSLRKLAVLETRSEHFLRVLEAGTVSTNVFLRRIQNFAVDMSWLPWPVLPKRRWPTIRFQEKRAIRFDEHSAIVNREPNPERRAFYELCWHLGGAQGDIANLTAEDIDWDAELITFTRRKTGTPTLIRFDEQVAGFLRKLPSSGPLFPYLRRVRAADRATEFKQRCKGLGIHGVTLHSYRYAWAERAKQCGYPERFAQQALGHNSKAVHRAYARHAIVEIPPLSEFERQQRSRKVIPMPPKEEKTAVPKPQEAAG